MAIQSLVAARIVYLVSISQLKASACSNTSVADRQQSKRAYLIAGIIAAVVLQIVFSQWPLMNALFATAPLTWDPVADLPAACHSVCTPWAIFSNLIDPPSGKSADSSTVTSLSM